MQIATRPDSTSGGRTALTISIRKADDGVWVQSGSHRVARHRRRALGQTTIAALLNPWNLLSRLDDIAQDVENMQLMERVWASIDRTSALLGANLQLSDRLRRLTCEYCGTANPVGEGKLHCMRSATGCISAGHLPQLRLPSWSRRGTLPELRPGLELVYLGPALVLCGAA